MTSISSMIRETSEAGAIRTEERRLARANLSEMRAAAIEEITTNPEQYQKFLDLLGDNIRCSPGNVALSLAQFKEPTHIGSLKYWHDLGRRVTPEEMDKGARVFAPARDPSRKGYFMGTYYDVSQTVGRPLKAAMKLEEDSSRMEVALRAVMEFASVPLQEAAELGRPAFYDPGKMVIAIDPSYTNAQIFAALTTELALSYAHNRGYNGEFSREEYQLDAESVGYLVCRRFGVKCPKPQAEGLASNYEGYDREDREKALNHLGKTARDMGDRVEKAIQPRQQERGPKRSPAR